MMYGTPGGAKPAKIAGPTQRSRLVANIKRLTADFNVLLSTAHEKQSSVTIDPKPLLLTGT
jgi:hypothetical protein